MQDLGLVGVLDALQDLHRVVEGARHVEALLAVEHRLQALALDVLHDDEEDAVHALGGDDADDVGVVEGGQQARLLQQVVEVAALAVGDLDRDLLVDPGVLGQEDGAEAAGAQVGEDLVLSDGLSQEEHESGAEYSRRLRRWSAFGLLPATVAANLLAARAPGFVESAYARGLYPLLASAFASSTGALPFSAAEGVLLAAAAAVLGGCAFFLWRLIRPNGPRRRLLARTAAVVWVTAGLVYAGFVFSWGMNYRRRPLAESLGLSVAGAPPSVLASVAAELVEEANHARDGLAEDAHGVLRLPDGVDGALRRVPLGFAAAARQTPVLAGPLASPKAALLSPLMSRLGITGIFFPFTGEAHVNQEVPAPDVPFTASHELAHFRGFAREDEASYVGYLACRSHPDPDFRYSGSLLASVYLTGALGRVDSAAARRLHALRSPGVRRDLEALRAWSERYRGRVQEASRRVNDAYLRTQGQQDGIRSYGRMVDLILAERRRPSS